jgi:hypothetical protein
MSMYFLSACNQCQSRSQYQSRTLLCDSECVRDTGGRDNLLLVVLQSILEDVDTERAFLVELGEVLIRVYLLVS